jgi:hypothetical protein
MKYSVCVSLLHSIKQLFTNRRKRKVREGIVRKVV